MYGILKDGQVLAEFVAPLDFLSNQPVMASDALSLKRTASVSPSQRWELECRLMPLSWDANELFVHFTVNGRHKQYTIIVPQNTGVIALRTSKSMGHSCTGARGAASLSLSNWSGNAPAGTFIRFNNDTKIYMITESLKSGSSSVAIYQPLRKAITSGTFNHQDDVQMPVWLDTDNVRGMRYTDGILMDLGVLKFVEAL